MRVLRGLHPLRASLPRVVATIGVFDGVHLGHQRLLRLTVKRARALCGTSVAVTFFPHPQHVLRPSTARPLLTTLEERLRLIAAQGVDVAWVIPFTRVFAQRSPEEFFDRVLRRQLALREVFVGEHFAFGKDRAGTVGWLKEAGARIGVTVHPVSTVVVHGVSVSSSRVRHAIEAGQLRLARRWLGRPHLIVGTVVHGRGRGRTLGTPTANLRLPSQVLPPTGVYAVHATLSARHQVWNGVMNLGTRPTFGETQLVAEAHLFGHPGHLYGQRLHIVLVDRLREERRFPTLEALTRQITRDLRAARALLSHRSRT